MSRWVVRVRYDNDASSTSVSLDALGVLNEIVDALMRQRYPEGRTPRVVHLEMEREKSDA